MARDDQNDQPDAFKAAIRAKFTEELAGFFAAVTAALAVKPDSPHLLQSGTLSKADRGFLKASHIEGW